MGVAVTTANEPTEASKRIDSAHRSRHNKTSNERGRENGKEIRNALHHGRMTHETAPIFRHPA
jgi:hypothetical protein